MKLFRPVFTCLSLTVVTFAAAWAVPVLWTSVSSADPVRPAQAIAQPAASAQSRESVETLMKRMSRGLKFLSKSVTDTSKKAENLRIIDSMELECVTAKAEGVPGDVLEPIKDPAERAKMAASFRTDLMGVLRKLVDLEQAVVEGDGNHALELVNDINQLKRHGHEDMKLN